MMMRHDNSHPGRMTCPTQCFEGERGASCMCHFCCRYAMGPFQFPGQGHSVMSVPAAPACAGERAASPLLSLRGCLEVARLLSIG